MLFSIVVQIVQGELNDRLHHYEVLKLSDILLRGQKDLKLPILDSYSFMKFEAFKKTFEIELEKSRVVTPSLEVLTVDGSGLEKKTLLQHTHYYTGTLTDDPTSSCTVTIESNGILAHISTHEEEFIIEPAWRHNPKYINSSDMMVYRKSDVKNTVQNHTVECAGGKDLRHMNISNMKKLKDDWYSGRHRRSVNLGNQKVCRILLVADHYFFNGIGGRSIPSTQNYMINMINQVNEIFKKTVWGVGATDLGLEISRLIVFSSFSEEGFNVKDRKMDMSTVLKEFGKAYFRENSQFCLMHLLTYTSFDGKLGLAFVASSRPFDWGGMCSSADTWGKEALNTGVSTFMDPQGNRQLSVVSMSTVAHEIGHNWGSNHDPDTNECSPSSTSGGRFLMFSRALKGVANNNLKFSPCSTRSIYGVLSTKGSKCLTEPRHGIGLCGNGRIDVGEECDPGALPDGCCSSTCQLASNAECSPVNFACCTASCQRASNRTECRRAVDDHSDCLEASYCNGIDLNCPAPSPKDNITCIDGGTCRNGVCVGFCKDRGQLPCVCSDESGNSCRRCCRVSEGAQCSPYPNEGPLPDGQICVSGFCKQGTCEKTSLPAQRLWKVIVHQITNSFEIFMKDNIVFFVTLFSLILYIPFAILLYRHDKKQDEAVDTLRETRNVVRMPSQNDIIRDVINVRVNEFQRRRQSREEFRGSANSRAGPSTARPPTARHAPTARSSTAGPSTARHVPTARPPTARPPTVRSSTAGPSTARPSMANPQDWIFSNISGTYL